MSPAPSGHHPKGDDTVTISRTSRMTPPTPRAVRVAALATSILLLLTACTTGGNAVSPASLTGGDPSGPVTTPAAAATYSTAPCPNPMYAAAPVLDLGPDFQCGYLTVPESRAQPNGQSIRIAVARVNAAAPNSKPDPLVYLTGGPGGSGLLSAVQRVRAGWNTDRDVIFLDQRGTWKSEPHLACPEIDAFLAEWPVLDTAAPATAVKSADASAACRQRLVTEGWTPSDYNTTENSADIADLRIAMGIDEWNLYGVSYGTNLALQVLRDHPAGIRSVVLDSVVAPQFTMDRFGHGRRTVSARCSPPARRRNPASKDIPIWRMTSRSWSTTSRLGLARFVPRTQRRRTASMSSSTDTSWQIWLSSPACDPVHSPRPLR